MNASPPIFDLPLSWARTDVIAPQLRTLRLPLARRTWVPCTDAPQEWSFQRLFTEYLQTLPGGVLLQNCNETLARYVQAHGGQVAQVGIEALLPLDAPVKTSLQELARRGRRWGQVTPLEHNDANRAKMAALWQNTVHGAKPQLQCAFRTDFDASVRGFALIGPEGDWLGAMTISLMKAGYWHTELLLRRQDAPTGVMEALILTVRARLLAEGGRWLSLGAAPFITMDDPLAASPGISTHRGKLITRMGRLLRFGYDYRGLYQFKAKFEPDWRPLYLCGWPDLPWRVLPDLSWASRHLHLMGHAAWQRAGFG